MSKLKSRLFDYVASVLVLAAMLAIIFGVAYLMYGGRG